MIKNKGIQLVTDIMGTKIKTRNGEDVGVIQNVMIEPETGNIIYIILCYANFIGKTNRHFAVPNRCIKLKGSEGSYYMEIDVRKLVSASEPTVPGLSEELKDGIFELLQDSTEFSTKFLN